MATYTVEISDGTGTYTFDAGKQPHFRPRYDWEYNEQSGTPHLTARIETWTLEDAHVTGSASAVTSDLSALLARIGSRATPVQTVTFKRDGSAVYTLDRAGAHKGGLMVRSLEPARGGAGQWATHWKGTLVVVGRALLDDGSGVVTIREEQSYDYDASGLAVVSLRGSLKTVPGTSAEEKARARALSSPGDDYGLQTAGPNGGEPSVRVIDPDSDTEATYESTWRQHGVTLPAGVHDYSLVVETVDEPGVGEVVTTSIRTKGPNKEQLKEAVKQKKPSQALAAASESEDQTAIERGAQFVTKRSSASTAARTGSSLVVWRRVEYHVTGANEVGGERDHMVDPIPGFPPYFTKEARRAKRVTETIRSRVRGKWASLADFKLEPKAKALADLKLQPGSCEMTPPRLEEQALTPDADLWQAEASYAYLAASVDPAKLAEIVKAELMKG